MPVITISRQYGSGGRTLGKRIAAKLGYYYADEDIIERTAAELNRSADPDKIIKDGSGDKLQNYISKLKPFQRSLMERPLTDKEGYIDGYKYVELLYSIIGRIAAEGDAVIIGRGGQFILENSDDAYHLFLIADEKYRVKRLEYNYNLSNKEAVKIVKRMEKRRANLYSYFGRKDYDDLTIYHLVLNMSMLSMDKAEELVCELINGS